VSHNAESSEPNGTDDTSRFVMNILNPDAVSRMDARHRIREVMEHAEALSMVFQPIVDLASEEIIAMEALARFHTAPVRAPDVWFAEAHGAGVGVELELFAVAKALAQRSMLPPGVALTVNLGPEAIVQPEVADWVADAAQRGDVLVLELTEHTRVDDYPGLTSVLQALRQNGARLAVDDTGAGFSSFAHILRLAPDYIKLDRDLVSGLDLDPVRRALVASIVMFGAETGAQVIAEGVENEDELQVLRGLGVTYGQGYHLGRPVEPVVTPQPVTLPR
jgi:EAL domain-containing protein (putative c-di-GMP-specific phosphodiesterase class I)